MNKALEITLASDIICPWCYVGKLRLQKAIDLLDLADQIKLSYRPHILYPDIPAEGKDVEKSSSLKAVKNELESGAAELGVTLQLRDIKRIPQTRPIHLALLHLDEQSAWEMKEHLFEAYFVQGQDLTDQKVINELFEKAGHHYDVNEAETGQLDALLAENRVLGISAVPTFVLNHDINITGAQPVDRWVNYLTKTLIKPSKI